MTPLILSTEMNVSERWPFILITVAHSHYIQLSYLPADDPTLDRADVEQIGLQDKGRGPLISAEHWTLKEAFHWFTSGHIPCNFSVSF